MKRIDELKNVNKILNDAVNLSMVHLEDQEIPLFTNESTPANNPDTTNHDAKPDFKNNPNPAYPKILKEQGIEGVVWMKVAINEHGLPTEILISKSSGYRLFDDAAINAVKNWRFIPAKMGGHFISSWAEFPIRFMLTA